MIELRRFRDEDAGAVRELHALALREAGAMVEDAAWDADLDAIGTVYLDAGGEFLVGVLDGEVVAMGALLRTAEREAELRRMRVHPDHQRHGHGRRLLAALEARARELGVTELRCTTTVGQTAARRLYERAGYREAGRGVEEGFEVIRYFKRVPDDYAPAHRS